MATSKWDLISARTDEIRQWYMAGAVDADVAARLKISLSTLNLYKTKHPEFAEMILLSKAEADDAVVSALFRKAIGTTVTQTKSYKCRQVYYDEMGNRCESEEIRVVNEVVAIPPDVTAQAIWLNNRRPKEWKRNAGKEQLDRDRFQHDKEKDAKAAW